MGIGMLERLPAKFRVKPTAKIDRPQRFQRRLANLVAQHDFQQRKGLGIPAIAQEAECLLTVPLVFVAEQRDQIGRGKLGQIERFHRLAALGSQPVNAAVLQVDPSLVISVVVHLIVVPVAHVNRAVRPGLDVHRTEPTIAALDRMPRVERLERRSNRRAVAHHHTALYRLHAEDFTEILPGQPGALVHDEVVCKARHLVVRHRVEVTKRIRIAQRSVLGEALTQIATLHVVEASRVAAVVPGEHPPLRVKLHAKRIAAALGKHLVTARAGMITPDVLAHGKNLVFIETRPPHLRRHRAALRAVKPPVRPPSQAVHHRMRILKPETGEVHHRGAVRNVVPVFVRIKKQVRRIEYPHAATPMGE